MLKRIKKQAAKTLDDIGEEYLDLYMYCKMIEDIIDLKQAKSLFNDLTRDKNSLLFGAGKITNNLIKEIKNSYYEKDKTFLFFTVI